MKKSFHAIVSFTALGLAMTAAMQGQTVAQSLDGDGYINLRKVSSTFTPPASLTGNQFIWWPSKGALVIGNYDFSMASSMIGTHSVALGTQAAATGDDSSALGVDSLATGQRSSAFGGGIAQAYGSVAIGTGAYARGQYAISMGGGSEATAAGGLAAVGGWARASGSVALRVGNTGLKKDGSVPDPDAPNMGDPVFELGAADQDIMAYYDFGVRRNSFTVFRDGTVRLSKASGGIAMGQFQ